MATVTTPAKPGVKSGSKVQSGGGNGNKRNGRGPGGDGPGGPNGRTPQDAYKLGMWLAVGGITMLFAALTSAYVVRYGEAQQDRTWGTFGLPHILWLSTGLLLASSITFEFARRALKADNTKSFSQWLLLTTALGLGFLASQLAAWQQLVTEKVFVNSNPYSSFFYMLTGTHGIHLICGILGLLYVAVRRKRYTANRRTAVEVTAIYWHFMDGLWIYLFLLLSFWR